MVRRRGACACLKSHGRGESVAQACSPPELAHTCAWWCANAQALPLATRRPVAALTTSADGAPQLVCAAEGLAGRAHAPAQSRRRTLQRVRGRILEGGLTVGEGTRSSHKLGNGSNAKAHATTGARIGGAKRLARATPQSHAAYRTSRWTIWSGLCRTGACRHFPPSQGRRGTLPVRGRGAGRRLTGVPLTAVREEATGAGVWSGNPEVRRLGHRACRVCVRARTRATTCTEVKTCADAHGM